MGKKNVALKCTALKCTAESTGSMERVEVGQTRWEEGVEDKSLGRRPVYGQWGDRQLISVGVRVRTCLIESLICPFWAERHWTTY